ncbi:L-histidine N(alpha)-methyltransferase [Congregibacter litoralis]|uniref:Putative methyltransferase n=1 Tax=Congregibacter litoralis KT71 TaxID=314285 RepID=A4A7D3_9GAMM|nr:L-histidine N(alpha)-methyltransferase [Congregibacter litoralis]EAQ98202.2 putative methyltransferase [Congregibacter litoralis KT71]
MNEPLGKVTRVSFRDEHPDLGDGREEILKGLSLPQKSVNPKWFYDQRGSELFDEITRLPEYYPTRTEVLILEKHREAIARICGSDCVLIEPGSGSSEKVRIFLDTLKPSVYVPIDISASFLKDSAEALGEEYPWLDIHAVCADFNSGWGFLDELPPSPRVVFYPGSTIGNLEPDMAQRFLKSLRDMVGPDGGVLIGVDTHKSTERLNAAYNDSAGVTADFNLNILRRMNELLDADFHESRFSHRAFYNENQRRIEMHLVSDCAQEVSHASGSIDFREGESIHTECSYKYSLEGFAALAGSGGFDIAETWQDDEALFSLHYLRAAA